MDCDGFLDRRYGCGLWLGRRRSLFWGDELALDGLKVIVEEIVVCATTKLVIHGEGGISRRGSGRVNIYKRKLNCESNSIQALINQKETERPKVGRQEKVEGDG